MCLKPDNLWPCALLFVLDKLVLNIIGSSMRDNQIAQKLCEERPFYQGGFLGVSKIICVLALRLENANFCIVLVPICSVNRPFSYKVGHETASILFVFSVH